MDVMREKMFRAWIGGGWFYFRVGAKMNDHGAFLYAQACEDGVEWFEFIDSTDKNEEKIFEGHIVKDDCGTIAVIEFERGSWHITRKAGVYQYPSFHSRISGFEIIGSTTEHPELLEAEAKDSNLKPALEYKQLEKEWNHKDEAEAKEER